MLDPAIWQELRSLFEGDEAGLADLVRTFADDSQRTLDRLADPGLPAERWRAGLHRLRSASAGIGAAALSALCADLEAGEPPGPDCPGPLLERLRREREAALRALGGATGDPSETQETDPG
ncbi:hypothetical protein EVJ50_01105 [Synechococcus sp. RSCCF101]|nr:hypothetical protein EVJ50_01105 [Synechococcus sp. RSCCF101]